MSNHHPIKYLKHPESGRRVAIDAMLAPLIEVLWAADYDTIGSCQDHGESLCSYGHERRGAYWRGYALLEMPVEDTLFLLETIRNTPQFKDKMHWAAPGAWEVSLPVMPFGWTEEAAVAPWVQIRFPNNQIVDLIEVLSQ